MVSKRATLPTHRAAAASAAVSTHQLPYALGVGFNSNYIDLLLSNFASAQLTNMLGSDEGMGVKQIAKVLLLFSIDEISKAIKGVLHELFSALQTRYQAVFVKLVQHAKATGLDPRALLRLISTHWVVRRMYSLAFDRRPAKELTVPVPVEVSTDSARSLTTTLQVPFAFAHCLVEYVQRNPSRCTHRVEAERRFTVVNLEEVEITETWADIQIHFTQDVTIRLQDRCSLVFTQTRHDHRTLSGFLGAANGASHTVDLATVERFSELLPASLQPVVTQIEGWSNAAYATTVQKGSRFTSNLRGDARSVLVPSDATSTMTDPDYTFEVNLLLLIKEYACPKLDVVRSFYDLVLTLLVLGGTIGLNSSKWLSLNQTLLNQVSHARQLTLFDHPSVDLSELDDSAFEFLEQSIDNEHIRHFTSLQPYRLDVPSDERKRLVALLDPHWQRMQKAGSAVGKATDVTASGKAADDSKDLTFVITASHAAGGEKERIALQASLAKAFEKFVRDVSATNVRHASSTGKVAVYRVTLERTNESVEVDNPAFKSQQQRLKALQTLQRQARSPAKRSSGSFGRGSASKRLRGGATHYELSDPESGDDWVATPAGLDGNADRLAIGIGLSLDDMPSKKLFQTQQSVRVVAKQITTVEKTFETLYLRAADKARLHSVLDLFHSRKDMIRRLGLPLKLGLLLHGLPGTGKTSTINAVASFLQKDIYYVSLKQVRTDGELLMIFQHVNHSCSAGGLIVFEELDLQSRVVVRPEFQHLHALEDRARATADGSPAEEQDDKPLTLDAILNVLQGSLTAENTCFIATTNHIERLEPALFRSGRFDLNIEMKLADRFQIATIFQQFMQRPLPQELLDTLPENHWSPADVIFFLTTKLFSQQTDEAIVQELRAVTPSSQLGLC